MRMRTRVPVRSGRRACGGALLLWLAGACTLMPSVAAAQGMRGWVGTNVQAVRLRPMVLDTIPLADIEVQPDGSRLYRGQPVACLTDDLCTVYATAPQATAWAATENVSLTAWGFGVQGLSFTTLLRARSDMGSAFVWPRTDDRFDAMLAYAELVRGPLRVRAGRQEIRGGLGFPAFDGASASYAYEMLSMEVYAGRSLERGLREPANAALQGLDAYLIDQSSYLFGGSLHGELFGTIFTARYQREILADRSGLV